MAQKYKVFYNDRIIFITESLEDLEKQPLVINFNRSIDICNVVNIFIEQLKDIEQLTIYSKQTKLVFDKIVQNFKFIEAAGGFVLNLNKELLCIKRLGKWDLPKGKVEKDEAIEKAAIREVEEECGVSGLKILREINSTYHIYELKKQLVLKQTHWFIMVTNDQNTPTPQTEEGISEIKWVNTNFTPEILENTYPSLKQIFSYFKKPYIYNNSWLNH